MGFEETELRLGLPGNIGGSEGEVARKRGFSQTQTQADTTTTHVDLKLNLSSKEPTAAGMNLNEKANTLQKEKNLLATDPAKPPAKYAAYIHLFFLSDFILSFFVYLFVCFLFMYLYIYTC